MSCDADDLNTQPVRITKGQNRTFTVYVKKSQDPEQPQDITGARIIHTVKKTLNDVSPVLQKDSNAGSSQAEVVDGPNGVARIYYVPGDTSGKDPGQYVHDVWVTLANGKTEPVIDPSPFYIDQPVK